MSAATRARSGSDAGSGALAPSVDSFAEHPRARQRAGVIATRRCFAVAGSQGDGGSAPATTLAPTGTGSGPIRDSSLYRGALCAIAAFVLLAGTACERAPALRVPAIRLLESDYEMRRSGALEEGAYTAIDGHSRPTFSSLRGTPLGSRCKRPGQSQGVPAGRMACELFLPVAPWVIVEHFDRAPEADPAEGTGPPPLETRRRLLAGGERRVVRTVDLPRRPYRPGLMKLPVYTPPPLSDRTVTVSELNVNGDATLRTWIAVEEIARGLDTAPVRFEIRLRDSEGGGAAAPLYARELDPARRVEDRGWQPVEVALGNRAGKPFELIFETRPAVEGDSRPALPVWGDPTIDAPGDEMPRPRRIVLVSLDTLRAKSMGIYGYERDTTPAFERLAREGTLFTKAFTTFSNTLGSHASMLTGLYPSQHGAVASGSTIREGAPTLAARLRAAGYETAAFTENALLDAVAGFQRGFASYYENKTIEPSGGDAEGTFARALEWIRRNEERPFFLFVHTYEVHGPHEPPAYVEELLPVPPEIGEGEEHYFAKTKALYEQEIRHLDSLLEDFVGGLGAAEDTLLIVTADHGEEFLDHGGYAHGQLYDEVMHIPLFVRWPGVVPAGLQVESSASLVDLVPTILELANAPKLANADGVSLTPLFEGGTLERAVVFGQVPPSAVSRDRRLLVARSERAKCMLDIQEEWFRCFDLVADPGELEPLDPSGHPVVADLLSTLREYRAKADVEGATPEEGPGPDPERLEKLRALGYVE